MHACCLWRRSSQVSAADLIERISDEFEPNLAHAKYVTLLQELEAALTKPGYVVAKEVLLCEETRRVLLACGFVASAGGGLKFPRSAEQRRLRDAHDLVVCLVASIEEEPAGTTTSVDPVPNVPQHRAETDDASHPGIPGGCDDAGPSGGTREEVGGGNGAGALSDREIAEQLVREEGPRVVTFERFREEDVLIDPEAVEEINKFCGEAGERYVDSQFPPLPRSLYISEWEADSWECLSCRARTKLPPQPPLPKSQEEAQAQEEAFKAEATCSGCGGAAPYVVQVRHFTRPTQWLRPGDRCQGCEIFWGHLEGGRDMACHMCTHFLRDSSSHMTVGSSWKLIREEARPEDVCQGGLGNCWFAGALSVVAQLPQLIDHLFLTKDYNPHGVYHVQLCHAGEWRGIVVDDLFPASQGFEGYVDGESVYFSRGGTLCYLQGARRQLWVPLVEKAAAKLFGCYGSLKGGTFGEALALFTGFPTQRIRLYLPKAVRQSRAQQREARRARRMQTLLQGLEVSAQESDDSDENADLTWSKLISCKDAGYLMGMGCTEEGCEKTKQHIVEEMGLQAPHAYGILDVREASVKGQVVRLNAACE